MGSRPCSRAMSGYYYPQKTNPEEEEEDLEFDQGLQPRTQQNVQLPLAYQQQLWSQPVVPPAPQSQMYSNFPQAYQNSPHYMQQQQYQPAPQPPQQYARYQQAPQYLPHYSYQTTPVSSFVTPTVPSNYPFDPQTVTPFPPYTEAASYTPRMASAGPSSTSAGYLSPGEASRIRASRSTSLASNTSSVASTRSLSPSVGEMERWGYQNDDGTWGCRYPGCSSKSTFKRGCDLRKHYKRHTKSLFCRVEGCPQATEGGFSSKKDRARHEAKHNPNIECEWEGCDRLFSRMDNMVCSNDPGFVLYLLIFNF